ncbi:MAG: amino acid racemase [Arenicellales bacterium]|nr:amino acid racemase [Arenicellales bacterium]
MLGVLGGMGPLATADFFEKFVRLWPAEKDQDHPQVVIFSNPKIPDRVGPILGTSATSPLPALIESAKRLQEFGAQLLCMPCHTAHFWYPQIIQNLDVPFLHIADITCKEILHTGHDDKSKVGVLATRATLQAKIYQDRFSEYGVSLMQPDQVHMEQNVLPAIAAVKRNSMVEAGELLTNSIDRFVQQGVEVVVLACTELPIALEYVDSDTRTHCIDPTESLARACVNTLRQRPVK